MSVGPSICLSIYLTCQSQYTQVHSQVGLVYFSVLLPYHPSSIFFTSLPFYKFPPFLARSHHLVTRQNFKKMFHGNEHHVCGWLQETKGQQFEWKINKLQYTYFIMILYWYMFLNHTLITILIWISRQIKSIKSNVYKYINICKKSIFYNLHYVNIIYVVNSPFVEISLAPKDFKQGQIHGYPNRVRVVRGNNWGNLIIWAGAGAKDRKKKYSVMDRRTNGLTKRRKRVVPLLPYPTFHNGVRVETRSLGRKRINF